MTKAARNERRKLLAGSINTAGLTAFGLGVLQPVFSQEFDLAKLFGVLLGARSAVLSHLFARWLLRTLEE